MLKKQMGRLVLVGISVAVIVILAASFVGANVAYLADNSTDNTSVPSPIQPPGRQPIQPPGQPSVPPEDSGVYGGGGCGGCGGCGGGGCGCPPQTAMSYTPPPPPPPSSPPPLPPLTIDVRTLPTNTQETSGGGGGGGDGGGGGGGR